MFCHSLPPHTPTSPWALTQPASFQPSLWPCFPHPQVYPPFNRTRELPAALILLVLLPQFLQPFVNAVPSTCAFLCLLLGWGAEELPPSKKKHVFREDLTAPPPWKLPLHCL